MNSFMTKKELKNYPFKKIGKNVLFSRKASIYRADLISIGNNVRIDDFCILSGKIKIGDYVHIAAYTALYGSDIGIEISDFANISSKVVIYAISDDFSGQSMTNPMIPDKYKNLKKGKVLIEKHVIIGSGSIVFPGVILSEGSSFGAFSLINRSSEPWSINAGIPFKKIKDRDKKILTLEEMFKNEEK